MQILARLFLLCAVAFALSAEEDKLKPRTDVPDAILHNPPVKLELAPEARSLFKGPLDTVYFTPWRELFNGKDIENWKIVGKALWKAEDGVLVGGQFGDPKRSGLIHTAESFTDFELELEFMIDEHGKYNSGVYLRNDAGTAARTGYQVNIGRGAAGEFCGGVYTTDWLAKGDEQDAIRKPNAWNALRILVVANHLRVDLNGQRIVTLTDPKPDEKCLQKGVIGFQTYGAEGHSGWVKFRNIRIRELVLQKP